MKFISYFDNRPARLLENASARKRSQILKTKGQDARMPTLATSKLIVAVIFTALLEG